MSGGKGSNGGTTSGGCDDARSIAQSLRRTQALLAQELERVSHVSEAIDQDGAVLQTTTTHQWHLKEATKDAKAALRTLQWHQQRENMVLGAAVGFFFLVASLVVWTRLVRISLF